MEGDPWNRVSWMQATWIFSDFSVEAISARLSGGRSVRVFQVARLIWDLEWLTDLALLPNAAELGAPGTAGTVADSELFDRVFIWVHGWIHPRVRHSLGCQSSVSPTLLGAVQVHPCTTMRRRWVLQGICGRCCLADWWGASISTQELTWLSLSSSCHYYDPI